MNARMQNDRTIENEVLENRERKKNCFIYSVEHGALKAIKKIPSV